MFGLKSKVEEKPVIVEEPVIIDIDQHRLEVTVSCAKDKVDEYAQLAEEIGFSPGALLEEKFRHWLKRQDIKIYVYDKVAEFMTQKYGNRCTNPGEVGHDPQKPGWVWVPLRKNDQGLTDGKYWKSVDRLEDGRTYQAKVPLTVLQLVMRIGKGFPDIKFYVSDLYKPISRPDPFLMATAVGMHRFVLLHWDEPDFTG